MTKDGNFKIRSCFFFFRFFLLFLALMILVSNRYWFSHAPLSHPLLLVMEGQLVVIICEY